MASFVLGALVIGVFFQYLMIGNLYKEVEALKKKVTESDAAYPPKLQRTTEDGEGLNKAFWKVNTGTKFH